MADQVRGAARIGFTLMWSLLCDTPHSGCWNRAMSNLDGEVDFLRRNDRRPEKLCIGVSGFRVPIKTDIPDRSFIAVPSIRPLRMT